MFHPVRRNTINSADLCLPDRLEEGRGRPDRVYGRSDGNAIQGMRQGVWTLQLSGLYLSDVSLSETFNDLVMSATGEPQDRIADYGTPANGGPGSGAICSVIFQHGLISSLLEPLG
jgi:hypothetical protein